MALLGDVGRKRRTTRKVNTKGVWVGDVAVAVHVWEEAPGRSEGQKRKAGLFV